MKTLTQHTELHSLVRELVAISAARISKQYATAVEREDVEQEIWAWCYGYTHHRDGTDEPNEAQLREWLETEGLENGTDYRLGCYRTGKEFDRVAMRYCRREKAAREGYEPKDEFFYSRGSISELLPLVWGDVQPDAQVNAEKTSSGKDPAEGGDLAAMVADIRAALDEVPGAKWRLLLERYRFNVAVEDMAKEHECALSTMYDRINRALDSVVEALGGRSPY